MRFGVALLLAAVAAGHVAGDARANGDPASDVLPFSNVFLSINDPRTSTAGRDLLTQTQAAAKLKRHEFYVRKLFGQAANYSRDELGEATVRLARLDLALKGGSKLPGDLELDRMLVEVTRAGR